MLRLIQNLFPARGRKQQLPAFGDDVAHHEDSKPLPRKGTETFDISVCEPLLRQTIQNLFPARGRKLVQVLSLLASPVIR